MIQNGSQHHYYYYFITLSYREGIYMHVFSNLLDQWFSNSGVCQNHLI